MTKKGIGGRVTPSFISLINHRISIVADSPIPPHPYIQRKSLSIRPAASMSLPACGEQDSS